MSGPVRLWRAHGLGNDYLVLEDGPPLDATLARALCDRHRGVGGDGVLEPMPTTEADHGVRIWNPDGSVAEKSGNGLRIFARWLVERRGAVAAFTVHTGTDRVACRVGADEVQVEMGHPTFTPAEVPVRAPAPLVDALLPDFARPVVVLSVGNPHCVVFVDEELDGLPWRAWGRALEVHPSFPNRTNVQIARVTGPRGVALRIWERGAGETLASGSSSCAVAAAGVRTGRLERGLITLEMPGGVLRVTVGEDDALLLAGPVEPVGRIEVDARWLEARTPRSG